MSDGRAYDGSEARRLAILASYPLDRPGMAGQLDAIARLAAQLCDAPVGLVSLVEESREHFVGRSGTELSETPREHAFCDPAMDAEGEIVVPDAREDARLRGNPLVTGAPGVRLYASQPLCSSEGAPLGTLCVIDMEPREHLAAEQIEGLRTLAEAAMALLERWRIDNSDQQQHELLTRELSHRIKNIFAVIGGLITLSLRRNPQLKEMGEDLQQRVLALGRAHDFVRPHSDQLRACLPHNSLHGMLVGLLGPYQSASGERIAIAGEDMPIDDRSATPLALFFHELATNAAKYGALQVDEGCVEIEIAAADPELVAVTWRERGGPSITEPGSPRFGASLIEMSVTRQLGGTLDYSWDEPGLTVQARIPVQMLAR